MFLTQVLSASLLCLSLAAHASEKFIPGADNKLEVKGVLSATVAWIKDKGGKFDLNLTLHNENTDTGMIVFLSDMGCMRGSTNGTLKHTFFNVGERTIDFRPGQSKDFNLVCKVEAKTKGPFVLTIAKVYDNPSMDGKTVGKIKARDLKWTQDDRRE